MMTIYQTVRSNSLLLLTVLFAVTNIDAQEKFISISTEAAHITKDTEEWFNITGLRVGLEYAFKKPYSLYIDYGKLTYFEGDKSYPNGMGILVDFTRGTITYRIVRLGGYVGFFDKGNVRIMLNLGGSLRFRQQPIHSNYRWSPEYTNTNQAYSRTFYETSKDVGTVFGLICKYKINEETHISTLINVENYSNNYELSESYSLISNQFTIHFKF